MKNLVISIAFGFSALLVSCEKDDLEKSSVLPGETTTSGVLIMNSKQNKGFSVDNLKLADFPRSDADFIIIPQTNLTGDVMSPFLSNPDLGKRFIFIDEFEDVKSAESYFNTNELFPEDESLQQFALNLKPNQLWLVKSATGEFCKILILETKIDKSTSFVEIRFKAGRVS